MPKSNYEHAAVEATPEFGKAVTGPGADLAAVEKFLAEVAASRDGHTIGLE